MSVIAVCSPKGSPGATTVALALAACWPRKSVLVEADPAGGDLAARFALPEEPGLVALAAAARREHEPGIARRFAQRVLGEVEVVVAPSAAEQASRAIEHLAGSDVAELAGQDADLVCDLGRLDRSSPALPLVRSADRLLVISRPQLADLAHLAAGIPVLTASGAQPAVVLVGPGPYGSAEVEEALGVRVAAHLPWDPRAAAILSGVAGSSRVLRTGTLLRAARSLAEDLAGARTKILPKDPPVNVKVPDRGSVLTAAGERPR